MSSENFTEFGRKTALQLSVIIGIILTIIMILGIIYAHMRDVGRGHSIFEFLSPKSFFSFFTNILLLYILFLYQFWVIKNHTKQKERFLITLLGSLVLLFILSPCFAQIQWWVFTEQLPQNVFLTVSFVKDMILLLISFLFTALILMWTQNQNTLLENQKLSVISLQHQYDALKNQVDPHFLFNSLNTLNGLIGYDDDKAHDYLDQLSSVFRYTMQNKQVIKLKDELNFVESYISLMKIRYNTSLQIEIDVKEEHKEYFILPFGLQILIENAIKHNVISNRYPMLIKIKTTSEDIIQVKNTVRLKTEESGGGIGLANLNERYLLVFDKEIKIDQQEDTFSIEIPLIKDIEKYNNKFNHK